MGSLWNLPQSREHSLSITAIQPIYRWHLKPKSGNPPTLGRSVRSRHVNTLTTSYCTLPDRYESLAVTRSYHNKNQIYGGRPYFIKPQPSRRRVELWQAYRIISVPVRSIGVLRIKDPPNLLLLLLCVCLCCVLQWPLLEISSSIAS